MRKLRLLLVLCAMTIVALCAGAAPAQAETLSMPGETSAGNDAALDESHLEYHITSAGATADEANSLLGLRKWLKKFATKYPNEKPKVYLDNDVTLNDGFTPMEEFSGEFDGQGHTITIVPGIKGNTTMNSVGLFTVVGGKVRCLGIKVGTVIVQNYADYGVNVGVICGTLLNDACIEDCSTIVTESVEAGRKGVFHQNANMGGITGMCLGTIENCVASVKLISFSGTHDFTVGGISGVVNNNGIVKNCYAGYKCDNPEKNDIIANGFYGGTVKGGNIVTAGELGSGELVSKLNGERGAESPWRQNLWGDSADAMPVIDPSHNMVYECKCGGVEFTNKEDVKEQLKHTPSTNASGGKICSNCGYVYERLNIAWPTASEITYGKRVSDSVLTGGSIDRGKFSWKLPDANVVPAVGESDYAVVFEPSEDTENNYVYDTESVIKVTVNPANSIPGAPDPKMEASYYMSTVGDLKLPDGWAWEDVSADIDLTKVNPGETTKAIATYVGNDASNYTEDARKVEITITRLAAPYVPPSTTETTVTKNPDGSTITTVKNKETGKETVTREYKEGARVITVKEPGAEPRATVTLPVGVSPFLVTLPVDATEATVAAHAGTREVINRCVPTEDGLAVLVTRSCELVVFDNAKAFSDMPGHWAQGAVDFASARGLMNGIGDTGTFAPDTMTSRAMVCAVLSNLEYGPEAAKAPTFADMADGAWYTGAIAWASEAGIVHGYGDGTDFGPDDDVTREQMACMIYNYAKAMGMDTTKRADLSSYKDADQLTFGREAMEWCVASGIFKGYEGQNELGGLDGLNRGQCAAVLMNLVTLIVEG